MSFTSPDLAEWVRDFTPGFLDTPEEDTLPGGATPDARNAELARVEYGLNGRPRRATLQKRHGARLVNPTVIDAEQKIDGLFEFRRTGATPQLVAICNGKVFVFDNINAFTQVGASAPFTAGKSARACFFKSNAILHDGAANRRYDGTSLLDLGFAKPTSVTNMSAVAPSGAGVSGTFEAYDVWYDQTADHESSPSAITATVSLTTQARRHTKPGGSPPSNVTHWRAYVRRTDTNEFNFFRAATIAVATATFDEELSDTARRDAGAGPYSQDNDQPPGAFAILVEWKGFGIGALANDDSYYVSKQGDLESWHPRNKFPVARGDGETLTSMVKYGTELVLHKGHASFRLVGDRVPFKLDPLHSKWGNVSQESALEVHGKLYAWDREKGPYWTDTVHWVSLVDGQVADLFATVNRAALGDIRAVYDETADTIRWAVATTGSTRKRLVFKYHVGLACWLPPDSGLEYGSFATFTTTAGALGVYMGDYWGRVYQLNASDREGVPTGSSTVKATVTAATTSTVTASSATFYTTGSGLAGMPVAVKSPAGVWQWRRIKSNTATVITLDTINDNPWTTTPDPNSGTWEVVVGGIQWYHWTPWFDFGLPQMKKDLHYFFLQGKASSTSHLVDVHARFDEDEGITQSRDYTFPTGTLSGVWGVSSWGVGLWANTQRRMRKQRIQRTAFSVQWQFSNFYPDQAIEITRFGLTADRVPGKLVGGTS